MSFSLDIRGFEPLRKGPETMRDQAIQETYDAGQGRSRPAGIGSGVDQVHRGRGTKMCLGCLVDELPHACGFVPPLIIPASWRTNKGDR